MIAAAAFVRGMEKSLAQSGSIDNVILLGAGSEESIERSEIKISAASQAAASIRGIRSRLGVAFVSPEVHMALGVGVTAKDTTLTQAVIRGVTSSAFLVHPQVRIIEGRAFNTGEDEIIVGALAATRLGLPEEALAVGRQLWVDGRAWTIVGRFEAPNTVMNAEIWCPLANIMILTRRETVSCVVLTLGDAEFADVEAFAATRLDLELVALRETDYYSQLTEFYQPVRMMVWVTALLIALGGVFGGLNTMYAAFAARVREIGMLRSLGFGRTAVIVSFVQESAITAAAGALIASALSLSLLDGVAVRFSMGAFGLILDGPTIAIGLLAGLVLGLVGSLPPTLRCLRLPIATSLKAA